MQERFSDDNTERIDGCLDAAPVRHLSIDVSGVLSPPPPPPAVFPSSFLPTSLPI